VGLLTLRISQSFALSPGDSCQKTFMVELSSTSKYLSSIHKYIPASALYVNNSRRHLVAFENRSSHTVPLLIFRLGACSLSSQRLCKHPIKAVAVSVSSRIERYVAPSCRHAIHVSAGLADTVVVSHHQSFCPEHFNRRHFRGYVEICGGAFPVKLKAMHFMCWLETLFRGITAPRDEEYHGKADSTSLLASLREQQKSHRE
jgi:hypothetical protein